MDMPTGYGEKDEHKPAFNRAAGDIFHLVRQNNDRRLRKNRGEPEKQRDQKNRYF